MDAVNSKKQIITIIYRFIEHNVCSDQEYPSLKNGVIGLGQGDLSYMLKETSYEEVYYRCARERQFNLCLLDGALIQFNYEFSGNRGSIKRHRLVYLPHPHLESFCENPDYEQEWLDDLLFSDVKKDSAIQFPIRFDFDVNEEPFVEGWHSYSHLTLGNVEGCRIPVQGPISPFRFIDFILRCFYSKKYREELDFFECDQGSTKTLTDLELKLMHMGFN